MIKVKTDVLATMATALLLLIATGCGGVSSAAPPSSKADMPTQAPKSSQGEQTRVTGDPEIGRAIFTGEKKLDGVLPCSTCHYVEAHQRILVGPNMDGLGERAATRRPGMSAMEYLEESIRDPEAYTVEGFPQGTMNETYGDRLSDEYMQDVIAYLLSL